MTRALALIDGEHYADVVIAAFAELPYRSSAPSLGGTEKLSGDEDYGVPLHESLEEGLEADRRRGRPRPLGRAGRHGPRPHAPREPRARAGATYVGADFRFEPVSFAPFELPSLAVIGSGKRVGKTAVAGHIARLLAEDRDVVVVAMGRGGPPEPVVVDEPPDVARLLALARDGSHAASDYLEDAALARVETVGCRRCGGGLAGAPFVSNVEAGARVAAERRPDLVLFEGSGAALPPVETAARILVAWAARTPGLVTGYLGAYRILLSDLVI